MARPKFTAAAYQDLEEILLYLGSLDPATADRVIGRIEANCDLLAENPGLGPAREDLAPDLRFFPVGKYLILSRNGNQCAGDSRITRGYGLWPGRFLNYQS